MDINTKLTYKNTKYIYSAFITASLKFYLDILQPGDRKWNETGPADPMTAHSGPRTM